jgi:hypothetical protein
MAHESARGGVVSERIRDEDGAPDLHVALHFYSDDLDEVLVAIHGGLRAEVGAEFSGQVVRVIRKVTEQ